jgi:hypothetical protein
MAGSVHCSREQPPELYTANPRAGCNISHCAKYLLGLHFSKGTTKRGAILSKLVTVAAREPTFLRQGPQLQQITQPAPQEPLQHGHTHCPLAAAAAPSSPWRFLRHLLLQTKRTWLLRLVHWGLDLLCFKYSTYQNERGILFPLPQVSLLHVTWSSRVF